MWIILVVAVVGVGGAFVISDYGLGLLEDQDPSEPRYAEGKRFIAAFDSLTDARLHPMVWRSGAFTRTGFDERRRRWTLTIRISDWERRTPGLKRDLAASLWAAMKGVRAQAGGDPELAELEIIDGDDRRLARCSAEAGVLILN
jgi:hypothetical protein